MKKGFTLTELLAVLVILGLLLALSYPVISKAVEGYREDLLKKQEENIVLAAKMWGSDNKELLPTVNNETQVTLSNISTSTDYGVIKITYGELVGLDYIDEAVNPVTKKQIAADDYYVLIKKSLKTWSYELKKKSE